MVKVTDRFTVDGVPLPVPDEGVGFSYEDLDSESSGRDESGVMHRVVLRHKVGSWSFSYSHLTEEEKQYLESLFGDKKDFLFGHPDRMNGNTTAVCRAYRSRYGVAWRNARTGLWSGYAFTVIEC